MRGKQRPCGAVYVSLDAALPAERAAISVAPGKKTGSPQPELQSTIETQIVLEG